MVAWSLYWNQCVPTKHILRKRTGDVVTIGVSASLLALGRAQAGMEHAAVQSSEVEFTDDHRHINAGGQAKVLNVVLVQVVSDHVAVLRGRLCSAIVDPGEAAPEIELVRSDLLDDLAADAEVLFGNPGVERLQVFPRLLRIRRRAMFEQDLPRRVTCAPRRVQLVDRLVFLCRRSARNSRFAACSGGDANAALASDSSSPQPSSLSTK